MKTENNTTTLTERTQGVWKVIPANYSGKGNAFKGFAFDIVAEVSDKEEVEICNVLPKELNTEDYAGTQPNTWLSKEQAEANAAFICKAVNEHDKLKAINDSLLNALKEVQNELNIIIEKTPTGFYRNYLTDVNIKTLSIIQKAEQ